jgi:molybdenum cofactor biosynthesis protein B
VTHIEHKLKAPTKIRFAIIIVSDSRYTQQKRGVKVEDESSPIAKRAIEEKGYEVSNEEIVPDESEMITKTILRSVEKNNLDAIITIGGTGISKRDVTTDSVEKLLTKEIPGFGEMFRSISFQRIGTAAILSRALAGIIGGKPIFCLPGSPQSIEVGLKELILPEIGHMLKHIRE